MADETEPLVVEPAACAPDGPDPAGLDSAALGSTGFVFDEDGTMRRTTPCLCLPESDAMAGWLACASCGLRQAPGKEWCGFCGSRWISAG